MPVPLTLTTANGQQKSVRAVGRGQDLNLWPSGMRRCPEPGSSDRSNPGGSTLIPEPRCRSPSLSRRLIVWPLHCA